MFFDVPSIIIVLGFDAGALLVSGGFSDFSLGLKAIFKKKIKATKAEIQRAADSFELMFKCSIGGGIIGLVMGLVMMLVNLNDMKHIGPYLAVAIITVFYGLILSYLFFLPGKLKLLKMAGK